MQSKNQPPTDRLAWAAAYDQSPLSAKAYAAQAGYSTATLYYWRGKLTKSSAPSPAFPKLEVRPPAATPEERLFLRLPGGAELHGPSATILALVQQRLDYA